MSQLVVNLGAFCQGLFWCLFPFSLFPLVPVSFQAFQMVFFHLEDAGSSLRLPEMLAEAMVILDVMVCTVYSSTHARK